MMSSPACPPIAGLILAGGLSRRMGGGDKALIAVEGQSLLERTIERLSPQVGPMILNANGDPNRFAHFTLPVVPDVIGGYAGPLAGILTGLEWLRDHSLGVDWMVSVAADTPLFPLDLVERLHRMVVAEGADIAVARTGSQNHPVFALWPTRLAAELRAATVGEGIRKIETWTDRYRVARVDWPAGPPLTVCDPFFNVNTPDDVARLRLILAGTPLPPAEPVRKREKDGMAAADEDFRRARFYGLLATLLASPPPADLLERIAALKPDPTPLGSAVGELALAAMAADADGVACEFQALFIDAADAELVPHAGWYLAEGGRDEPLAALRRDMARLGIEHSPDMAGPEDHAASLCEVMQELITGLSDTPVPPSDRKAFYAAHVQSWMPRFLADLEAAAPACFYRAVGKAGGVFLQGESQAFAVEDQGVLTITP